MVDENIRYYRAKMEGEIRFNCPYTGKLFRKAHLETDGLADNQAESIKKAVQRFLNGEVEIKNEFFIGDFDCIPDEANVHYIDFQVGEPFKSLLTNLFNNAIWKIPKEHI